MPPQKYQAKVAEHILLSKDYHWYTIDLTNPTLLDFQAGQFLMLDVPGIAAKKAYSIPSSPANKSQLNLLVDVSPQGDGTRYLQSLSPGDEISFMAPAGLFVLADNPAEENYSLIATGSGISAVRSMLLWLLHEKKVTNQINLHWGMRYVEDIFWEEDFRMLENQFPNFHFDLVLSKAPEGWPMCSGHINDCLLKHYQDFSKTGYYLCGSNSMIEGVSQLLSEKGVLPEFIHHERFG
jgi:phenol/toluene 2-monooxygenase (NADH) P5/A5